MVQEPAHRYEAGLKQERSHIVLAGVLSDERHYHTYRYREHYNQTQFQ